MRNACRLYELILGMKGFQVKFLEKSLSPEKVLENLFLKMGLNLVFEQLHASN